MASPPTPLAPQPTSLAPALPAQGSSARAGPSAETSAAEPPLETPPATTKALPPQPTPWAPPEPAPLAQGKSAPPMATPPKATTAPPPRQQPAADVTPAAPPGLSGSEKSPTMQQEQLRVQDQKTPEVLRKNPPPEALLKLSRELAEQLQFAERARAVRAEEPPKPKPAAPGPPVSQSVAAAELSTQPSLQPKSLAPPPATPLTTHGGSPPPPPERRLADALPPSPAPSPEAPQPPAPPPEAIAPPAAAQQPIQVWTREVALQIAAQKGPIPRRTAHNFLATWRAGGSYPAKHFEDLTNGSAFCWQAYLASHQYSEAIFGRDGVHKFEIRYLRPHDTNTGDFRCDFVAYKLDGAAIRLHPGGSSEAIPVWSPNIRALAMDWSPAADPLPQMAARTREVGQGDVPIFRHISDHDRIHGKAFQGWLAAEQVSGELRDITQPAADGCHWFPWPLLLASTVRLGFLASPLVGVSEVATCRMFDGTVGLMFRRKDTGNVVTASMDNGVLTVHQGDAALVNVLDVPSASWRRQLDAQPPASSQGEHEPRRWNRREASGSGS